jgi:hypothetical protein
MTDQISLSDNELQVMLDLLEEYRRELPSEIRRTDTIRVHDELQERLKVVDGLIDKLRHTPVH